MGHDLDLLWSLDVIGHVTIRLPIGCFLYVVNGDLEHDLSGTVIEIFSLEDNGVTTLTFGVT